ncbi:MAG: PAN domain-containing protein [Blastocatellia bacterium]
MKSKTRFLFLALTMIAVLLPFSASTQNVGTRLESTALNGTRLTYYQRPNMGQCEADCVNNPRCKGYTWIQAGTYSRNDPAMCYLMAEVTGTVAARGHTSAVKGTTGGGNSGTGATNMGGREANISLNGNYLTYHPRSSVGECETDCANNPTCKGYTWIQAGTYKPTDQAMCYLYSAVTGRVSARGHISAVKGTTGGNGGGGGGGAAISAFKLEGSWQFHQQCKGSPWELLIGFKATSDTTFEGGFENGNGLIKNGRVSGNQITFTRVIYGDQVQQHLGTLVNEGGL